MSAGQVMDFAARLFGYTSMAGFAVIVGIAVSYSVKDRAAKRRKAIADDKRRHPAGKAFQCPICLNPWHHPEACDRCADILIVLDKEVSS
jgi:hypothetical protein